MTNKPLLAANRAGVEEASAGHPLSDQSPGSPQSAANPGRKQLVAVLLVSGLLAIILSVLIMAAVPPVSRDALTHHLAVPKMWIEHGGIYEIPDWTFSYSPMNLDLLYVVPLLVGNDIAPKYIHYLFALGTAGLIYAYLRKRTSQLYALLGALLFLSTPVIVKLSISAYVDLGLIFFSWAAIYFIFRWLRTAFNKKYLIIAALFCGLGLGTKYNGLLVFFLLTLFVPLVLTRTIKQYQSVRISQAFLPTALFVFVALSVFSPWMVKNYKWTGNPVYPLFHKVFAEESDQQPGQQITMKPWLQRKLVYRETALQTALIPVRIFFEGQDDNPKYFDGRLNPILLIFPLLAFCRFVQLDKPAQLEHIVLAGFSIFYLLYASFFVDMRIRYIGPIIPPLVVLAVLGIKNAWAFAEQRAFGYRAAVVVVVTVLLAMNALYSYRLFIQVDPVSFLGGSVSRSEYIEKFRPEYPLVQTANSLMGEKVKLLALFLGNRRYYFEKQVEFDTSAFQEIVDGAASAEMVASALLQKNFTHVIVGVGLFQSWAKSVFQNDKRITINQFFQVHCKIIDQKNGYALFSIGNARQ